MPQIHSIDGARFHNIKYIFFYYYNSSRNKFIITVKAHSINYFRGHIFNKYYRLVCEEYIQLLEIISIDPITSVIYIV